MCASSFHTSLLPDKLRHKWVYWAFSMRGIVHAMMYYIYWSGTQDALYLPVKYIGCIISTSHIHRMYCIYRSRATMRGVPAHAFYGHFCRCTYRISIDAEEGRFPIKDMRLPMCWIQYTVLTVTLTSNPPPPRSYFSHIFQFACSSLIQLSPNFVHVI